MKYLQNIELKIGNDMHHLGKFWPIIELERGCYSAPIKTKDFFLLFVI